MEPTPAGLPSRLDREAPLPLYVQLRDALLREIHEGGLQPGDRFPSETAIRDRYPVSRATIRQALADLETGGVIRKVQGLGSFVAAPKIRHVPLLTSDSRKFLLASMYVRAHALRSSGQTGSQPGPVQSVLLQNRQETASRSVDRRGEPV